MLTVHPRRLVLYATAMATVAITVATTTAAPAGAAGWGSGTNPRMASTVVGKAAPDECWIPPVDPNDPSQFGQYATPLSVDASGVHCPSGSVPKVNQAYVWGLTRTGGNLWFGTVANTQCLVMGTYLGLTSPMLNETSVCELSQSPEPAPIKAAGLGDWRPPQLFRYAMNSSAQPVSLLTLPANAGSVATIQALLNATVGIRSAASAQDPFDSSRKIIVFAGPSLSGGLTMLAFADDGTFLQGTVKSSYNDIRRWVSVSGQMYTGVGKTDSTGAVLQWAPIAATISTPADYLNFTEVIQLPSDVAELTIAQNHLVAGTWPNGTHEAGVWIGPSVSDLSGAWTQAWTASDYEPDATTALTYGAGAMATFGDYVYWGTMHVPGVSAMAAEMAHPSSNSQEALANFVGSYRAISLYRVNVATGTVQLLYGEAQLPAYVNGSWQLVNNNMGGVPGLYGSSGFGNLFNNYTWSMAQYGGQLYVGTMDWSYLAAQAWPSLAAELGLPPGTPNPLNEVATYGADLYRFASTRQGAQMVSDNGIGNPLNYGVRNMLPVEDASTNGGVNGLYIGMADPENLATTGSGPKGGWELIRMAVATKK